MYILQRIDILITDGRIAADRHCLTHLGLSGPGKVKISSQDPVKLLCSFLHTQEELHQLGGGTTETRAASCKTKCY